MPLAINVAPPRILVIAGISIIATTALAVGIVLAKPSGRVAAASTVPVSTAQQVTPIASSAPIAEMNIANSGMVHITGGHIVSIANGALNVRVQWGVTSIVMPVRVDSAVHIFIANGEKGQLTDLQPGDTVIITGNLDTTAFTPTIFARFIRKSID